MSTSLTTSQPQSQSPVRKCRFIVKSAEEAVTRVRETLGPEAKVVSVQQVKGEGLQRFLSAPRLEIIAQGPRYPEATSGVAPEPAPPAPAPEATEEKPSEEPAETAQQETAKTVESSESLFPKLRCGDFLDRAGLPMNLLARLDADASWRELCDMNLQDGLPRVVRILRNKMQVRKDAQWPTQCALIGGPGAGKTTALCKILARDVFIHGKDPQVLRLEVDKPHLDDGLLLYCDVLGVPCVRSMEALEQGGNRPIYVDVPGFSLNDGEEHDEIRKALDEVGVHERVIVLNAAYESEILQKFACSGERIGAQYHILTHLDELDSVGKLWSFLFDTTRQLLFFSNGQNIASDLVEDPFGYLIEHTFPK